MASLTSRFTLVVTELGVTLPDGSFGGSDSFVKPGVGGWIDSKVDTRGNADRTTEGFEETLPLKL